MIALAALLLAAAPHGAEAAPGPDGRTVAHRAHEYVCERRDARGPCHRRPDAPRAGDPVALRADFFQAREAGGVGREPVVLHYAYRPVLIVAEPAPRSAGRAAARRGLGRD